MNIEKFSERSQKAIKESLVLAEKYSHQHVTAFHLLKVICDNPVGNMTKLIESLGVDIQEIQKFLNRDLEKRPKVKGSTCS